MLSKPLSLFCLIAMSLSLAPAVRASGVPDHCQQLIVVTTPNWNSVTGSLARFTRSESSKTWQRVGTDFPIVVGRSGVGWGLGLHSTNGLSGPMKREGDGRSPAGIFRLSSAFGLEPLEKVSFIRMPYQTLLPSIECVDDVKSAYYNQLVNRSRVGKVDWDSSEKMREVGEQYRLGVFVNHNVDPRQPGCGSCIFLHIWKNDHTGTSGCTAMTRTNMEELLRWLDPDKRPVLVQLPQSQYKDLQKPWQLP